MYILHKLIGHWLLLIIISFNYYIEKINAGPPFPLLTGLTHLTQKFQILSEVTWEGERKYILDEHLNFKIRSEHVVKTTLDNKYTILIDGITSSIFNFNPYNCELLGKDDLVKRHNFNDIWQSKSHNSTAQVIDKSSPSSKEILPFIGVSAIWLNAAFKTNKYIRINANKHSYIVFFTNYEVNFVFTNQDSVMRLRSIECTDVATKKIIFSVNVIDLKYNIEPEDDNRYFSLPVVYGCAKILKELGHVSIANDENDGTLDKVNIHSASSYKISIEVSVTGFSNRKEMITSTDVMDLMIAGASLDDQVPIVTSEQPPKEKGSLIDLRLIHIKGYSDKIVPEMKEVIDYSTGVKYTINMGTNECIRQGIASQKSKDLMQLMFKNNNISLNIDESFIQNLLDDTSDFILNTKWVTQDKSIEYLYYEREEQNSMFNSKQTTICKTYSRRNNVRDAKLGIKNTSPARLEKVKVILYNDDRTHVEFIYLLMINSYETDLTLSDRAKLFDLSTCFQEVNQHKWISIYYPLDKKNIPELSEHFYKQHSNRNKLQLNFLRVPKIEQTYKDCHVVLRALLLDTRPEPLVQFDKIPGLLYKDDVREELHVAANRRICSDICKMYNCHIFSYCSNNECKVKNKSESLISDLSKLDRGDDSTFEHIRRDNSCTLYVERTGVEENFLSQRHYIERPELRPLNDILAQLDHDEYYFYHKSNINHASSSNTDVEYNRVAQQIITDTMPDLSFAIPNFWALAVPGQQTMIALTPISFEIEREFLDEMLLSHDANQDDREISSKMDAISKAFHDSLGRRRFSLELEKNLQQKNSKTTVMVDNQQQVLLDGDLLANNNDLSNDDDQQQNVLGGGLNNIEPIEINDQTYEECALLCIDRGEDCGSFSYCHMDRQCITSGQYDKKAIIQNSIEDSQCVIVQRDFLSKFSPFELRTSRPAEVEKTTSAYDEHDCAHQCIVESKFNCLSFDYCTNSDSDNNNNCLLETSKELSARKQTERKYSLYSSEKTSENCQRYQRSFLADFNRLDHRRLSLEQLTEFNLVPIIGVNVDECASQCVEKNKNCNIFQFCYHSNISPHQTCHALVAMSNEDKIKIPKSKLMYYSNCYIYTMKKDITTKSLYMNRDVDDERLKNDEREVPNEQVLTDDVVVGQDSLSETQHQLSVTSIVVITFMTFVLSLMMGIGYALREHYKEELEQKYRRLKTLWFGVTY